jgi:hypothetical protein
MNWIYDWIHDTERKAKTFWRILWEVIKLTLLGE